MELGDSRTIEVDDIPVTFAVRKENVGACMQSVLTAAAMDWSGTVLDGLDGHASVEDFSEAELMEMYRSARHMREDMAD